MASQFQDHHVVVTGGTGALGAAVVARLLDHGAICHIPCFQVGELDNFPYRHHDRVRLTHPVDLSREDEVTDYFKALPRLWASIHCAGGFAMAEISETRFEDYRRLMAMNADSCFLCCREAVRAIRRSDAGGRIVNVAARPALEPRSGASMVAYTASKSAVAAITLALSEEVADEGIWVNAVAPSIIDTPANRQAMPDADHGRWPSVEAIAASVVFLASPENRSTRSSILPVYGRS